MEGKDRREGEREYFEWREVKDGGEIWKKKKGRREREGTRDKLEGMEREREHFQ